MRRLRVYGPDRLPFVFGIFRKRFVGFQRSRKRTPNLALLALGFGGPLLAPFGPACAAAESSFVYCLNHGSAKIFAGKTTANGNLVFGVSVWSPSGNNISLFGTALKSDHGWLYTDNLTAVTARERCRLSIVRDDDGTLHVAANHDATCERHGGANTNIGTLTFPGTAYEGTVTNELDDPEMFQRAGKCAR
jgi:hypothetical protein